VPDPSRPLRQDGEPALPDWLEPLREGIRTMRAEDLSAFVPPEEPKPREGAVLVLFGEGPEGPDLLLTERAHTMRSQPGQVSFPGGSLDPGETAVEGALREAHEETGLDPDGIEPLGTLPEMPVPVSRHIVTPVPAWWTHPSEVAAVDHDESVDVFRIPVADLLEPANRAITAYTLGDHTYRSPAFTVGGRIVWGFTALVLSRMFDELGWVEPWDEARIVERDDLIG
jgi:8-oxo-dGTP pyrophosphatase MutT (NUDIX family)